MGSGGLAVACWLEHRFLAHHLHHALAAHHVMVSQQVAITTTEQRSMFILGTGTVPMM